LITAEDIITNLSYKDLWQFVKSKVELSRVAAEEIRSRRRRGALPMVEGLLPVSSLNRRQKHLYERTLRAMPSKDLEICITDQLLEGWTVFLTGDDDKRLDEKLKKTRGMILTDIEEFGSCRLFIVPLNTQYIGLKLCFDRGLRCVHAIKANGGPRAGG